MRMLMFVLALLVPLPAMAQEGAEEELEAAPMLAPLSNSLEIDELVRAYIARGGVYPIEGHIPMVAQMECTYLEFSVPEGTPGPWPGATLRIFKGQCVGNAPAWLIRNHRVQLVNDPEEIREVLELIAPSP